jgi:TIR domain
MSYVKGTYDNDVFISYAHNTYSKEDYRLDKWVHSLKEALENIIKARGRDAKDITIVIDAELDLTSNVKNSLKAKCEGTALFLVIMTDDYLESSWCTDEANWFQAEMKKRGRTDEYFIVVCAQPTFHAKWPRYLKDDDGFPLVGHKFHSGPDEPEENGDLVLPYSYLLYDPERFEDEYRQALLKLAREIFKRLNKIRNLGEEIPQKETFVRPDASPVIYLHAGADDAAAWQREKGLLEAAGFTVKPANPPTRVATGLELHERRRQRLTAYLKCEAVLILRPENGHLDLHDIIASGHLERMEVEAQLGKRMPCAVVDRIGDLHPHVCRFGIDVLGSSGADMAVELREWLSSKALANAELVVVS